MNLFSSIKISVYNLLSNKLRSILTMLGIIIGVGSVIALQSIGEGRIQDALASVEKAGTNLVTVSLAHRAGSKESRQGKRARMAETNQPAGGSATCH